MGRARDDGDRQAFATVIHSRKGERQERLLGCSGVCGVLHISILIPETSLLILVTPRSSMSAGVIGESSQALPGVSGKQSPPCAERSCRSLSSPPLAGVVARPSFPPSVPSLATAPGSALPPTVARGSLLALCPCRGSPRFTPIREPLLCPPLPQPRSHGGARLAGDRSPC